MGSFPVLCKNQTLTIPDVKIDLKNPLIRFIVILAMLVLAGVLLRLVYHFSPAVNYYVQHSVIIDTIYRVLIGSTSILLTLTGIPHHIGYDKTAVQYFIHITETNYLLYLWIPCLGLSLMYAYASLIIAFPGKWFRKLAFILGGWLVIQVLNILRLFGISLLLANDHSGNNIAKSNWIVLNHEDIFNYFVVFLIFMMFVVFARKLGRR
jgi:exosortase/archaeosortase family protein